VLVKVTLGPKKASSTVAAAMLKALWPDTYSGKGGVFRSGSNLVPVMTPASPVVMAVIGRQKL